MNNSNSQSLEGQKGIDSVRSLALPEFEELMRKA